MEDIILKTNQLTKIYQHTLALDHVNMTIHRGDIYGLVGLNGAGKTTLMKVIASLVYQTSGSFTLFSDEAAIDSKRRIGCLIENPAFYPNLSAYENLKYYAIQWGIVDNGQIDHVLEVVGLENNGKKFKNFSLGMKQRLGVALAILNHPDFLILDEPINGLDPLGISQLRETLVRLNEKENITILISSHILSELYLMANHFGFIHQGKLKKELSKEQLDQTCRKCLVIQAKEIEKVSVLLEEKLACHDYSITNHEELRLYEKLDQAAFINRLLVENKVKVKSIYESGISLEDYFKKMIKEQEDNND